MSGRNSPLILYSYINRYAETPNKTKTKDTMSLDYSSICYIGSGIGWVSKEIFKSCKNDNGKLFKNYSYGT